MKCYNDPFLKLHVGIPLMFTLNADVINDVANGTLCYSKRVKLKSHILNTSLPKCCVDGYYVNIVSANDVDHLICQLANSNENFIVNIQQHTKVYARLSLQHILSIPMPFMNKPEYQSMSLSQFPVLVNHACTGHKLQGQTKPCLFISSWSNTKNGPYVMLSQVKSLPGLVLRQPLNPDPQKYAMSSLLQRMLTQFRLSKTPAPVIKHFFTLTQLQQIMNKLKTSNLS